MGVGATPVEQQPVNLPAAFQLAPEILARGTLTIARCANWIENHRLHIA